MTLPVLKAATIIFKTPIWPKDYRLKEEVKGLLLLLYREGYRVVRDVNIGH